MLFRSCRRIRGLVSGGRDEQKPERHMLQLATRCPTRPFPLFCGQKKRAGNVAGPALTHQNCTYMCRRTCEEVSLGGGMGVALPGTRYLDIAVLGRVSVLAGSPPASTSDWREMEQKGMREMGGGERVILCVCVCHHPISLFLSLSLTHHDRPSFQCLLLMSPSIHAPPYHSLTATRSPRPSPPPLTRIPAPTRGRKTCRVRRASREG